MEQEHGHRDPACKETCCRNHAGQRELDGPADPVTTRASASPAGTEAQKDPAKYRNNDPENRGVAKRCAPRHRYNNELELPGEDRGDKCPDHNTREDHERPVNFRDNFTVILLLFNVGRTD